MRPNAGAASDVIGVTPVAEFGPPAGGERSAEHPRANPRAHAPDGGLICVGVSYRTASLSLRERLAVSPDAVAAALARFGCGRDERPSAISELVVLSTCNRIELYAAGGNGADQALVELIEESTFF